MLPVVLGVIARYHWLGEGSTSPIRSRETCAEFKSHRGLYAIFVFVAGFGIARKGNHINPILSLAWGGEHQSDSVARNLRRVQKSTGPLRDIRIRCRFRDRAEGKPH